MITPTTIAEAIARALDDVEIAITDEDDDRTVGTPSACGCPGCSKFGPNVIFVEDKAYAITLTEVAE